MSTVISVENLSKAYRLGTLGGRTLREDFARWWARLRGQPDPFLKVGEEHKRRLVKTAPKASQRFSRSAFQRPRVLASQHVSNDVFWALRNVSFKVKQGEVLGIIGRNGAGKSTLLKILSRVTGPTEGQIRVKGRIASLLEVGTGFHPDLTGRENVFLNGAILGMTKAEIRKKFDEIVAFAEIEEFIDTPVKRYSSGMYVRLAFAVAAHLEPEILIVDEVLAVGDAEFQKKCLGKMRTASRCDGRAVLFVSHNLAAVLDLCNQGLVLDQGGTAFLGGVGEACTSYINLCRNSTQLRRNGGVLRWLSLVEKGGARSRIYGGNGPLFFRCSLRPPVEGCLFSLIIRDSERHALCELFDKGFSPRFQANVDLVLEVKADSIPLRPGEYSVDFWCGGPSGNRIEMLEEVLQFDVVAPENNGPNAKLLGPLRFASAWRALSQQ